jgi:hypothetical protein
MPEPAERGGAMSERVEGSSLRDRARIEAAAEKARILYEGTATPHRSCGIALAETFGLPTASYQALRRGGILGRGDCGAIKAGELVLGELLGDPDPTGAVRPALRSAMEIYDRRWREALFGSPDPDIVCNHLTEPLGDFMGARRRAFCTGLSAEVARFVAEALVAVGHPFEITPIAGVPNDNDDTP